MPSRAVVQIPGRAVRLDADTVRDEVARCGSLHDVLLRYTHALMTQISLGAACNRFHTVDERLCRLLLSCRDRLRSPTLDLTQEALSSLLGVRRESVTIAARHLQDAGLIRYARGHIAIQDHDGLEARACECYRAELRGFSPQPR